VKRARRLLVALLLVAGSLWSAAPAAAADLAVRGETVYTMAGAPIADGVVLIENGKIAAVGPASEVAIPEGVEVLRAKVVIPGLVDARGTVGLTGHLNQPHDQDQLERSEPLQPELRALDAYNARDPLVEWVRSFGVTTVHTGHAPGAVISGQTMIVKTAGETVDEAMVEPVAMIAATLGDGALAERGGRGASRRRDAPPEKSPGTRPRAVAMLRAELVKAQAYRDKRERADAEKKPDRDLRLDALVRVLDGELPLLVAAHRHHDILAALRVAEEFGFELVLDGASEAYLLTDEILAAGVPVIVHPAMKRAVGEAENLSFTTAGKLADAGIPIALESGFEAYVPKTRVLLFEAAVAAAHGLGFDRALAAATIDSARLLGIADRVGSLEPGKDADLALYDGDPFEYTTHCVGVVIDGVVVSDEVW
jgi:imidazolonepropionase-like amidohydrolase